MARSHKLKGVARRAVEKQSKTSVDLPATYVKRNDQTDEQIRHVLLYWMQVTVEREERRYQEIQKEVQKERERLELIKQAKRVANPKDYEKIQARRQALQKEPVSNVVPGCYRHSDVRAIGARDGTGASYRIVPRTIITPNGVEEQLFEERIQ